MNTEFKYKEYLDFEPDFEQVQALENIYSFLHSYEKKAFVLTGAAGTGKTSLLKAIINYLNSQKKQFHLLAPTGRAAHIISKKTGSIANTIHSHLYRIEEIKDDDGNIIRLKFVKRPFYTDTPSVYLVDESSMISDKINNSEQFSSSSPVLTDLIELVKKNKESKIIFIGDPYQLPPIKSDESPALILNYLIKKHALETSAFELVKVKRQNKGSYIQTNAQEIKKKIINGCCMPSIQFEDKQDLQNMIDAYVDRIRGLDREGHIMIAWKNITIHQLNLRIRQMLFGITDQPIHLNERLVMHQSSYLEDYLPSGTMVQAVEIDDYIEQIAGHQFATIRIKRLDTGNLLDSKVKVNLNILLAESGHTDINSLKDLWAARYKENKHLQKTKDPKSDPYLSAFKLRYAYAITAHKAQGGEWDEVYLHPEFPYGQNGLRWLYTAITRAKESLFSFNE